MIKLFGKNKEELKKEKELAELERMAKLEFPISKLPNPPFQSKEYQQLTNDLGFIPAELTRDMLLSFFIKEGMPLFDNKSVHKWMVKKRKEVNINIWYWRPLREKDIITDYMWGEWTGSDGYYRNSHDVCRPYEQLIPANVLQKVKKIENTFKDQVKFFVSDIAIPMPDPFIMVRPAKRNSGNDQDYMLIFDAWDEPGYGDESK